MTSIERSASILTKAALVTLTLLPVAFVFVILTCEMSPIPIGDDYNAIFGFLLNFQHLPTLTEKLLFIVAATHNEYKLIFEHLIVTMQFSLSHHTNLIFLITLGNLFLIPLLIVHWKGYFASESDLIRRLLLFLPISFLIFQLNYVDTLDWAMIGLQTVPVVFFSFASIYFLTRYGSTSFTLACFCSIFATMSSANGILVGPIGLLMLFPSRNYRRLFLWLVSFSISLASYLYHPAQVKTAAVPFYLKALFFLSFLGGGIESMHHFPLKYASIALGTVMFFAFVHALRAGYYRDQPFAFFSTLWVLLTTALVANIRVSHGVYYALSGRYKIYSDLLLVFCYGYAIHHFTVDPFTMRGRKFYISAIASIVLLSAASDIFGYKFLVRRRTSIEEGWAHYLANPSQNSPLALSDDGSTKNATELLELVRIQTNQAIENGIYIPPCIVQK